MKIPSMNRSGFTLPEIMFSLLLLTVSIMSLGQLFVFRKKDEVLIKSYTQIQSISQQVISRYYSSPSDFPASNNAIYVACMSEDGNALIDFFTYAKPNTVPTGLIANVFATTCPANAFEVHMLPSATKPSFTIQIYPMSATTLMDRNDALHNSQFELPYEQSFGNSFNY